MSTTQPTRTPISERHLVETPEQIHLAFAVAGIGSRFLAIVIDTLIQLAIGVVAGIVLGILMVSVFRRLSPLATLWILAGAVVFYFLLHFGYFAAFEILWNGQTPGKRRVGIRVIKESGRPLVASESIARNLMRIVDQMPAFYAIGIVTAMCNAKGKRLGDFVAGSIVIREKGLGEIDRSWAATSSSVSLNGPASSRLTPHELSLVETFLLRRGELEPAVRHRMAIDIVTRLQASHALPDDARDRPESALELLAYQQRSV